MAWNWRYEDADGGRLDRAAVSARTPAGESPQEFPSQSDAESWLGESWRDLAAAGVDRVTLLDDERVVYAGMALRV